MVPSSGLVQVTEKLAVRPAGGLGFIETFQGDRAELAGTLAPPEPVALVAKLETPPVPALGLVEIAEGGQILEGMAKVERANRRPGAVADSFRKLQSLLVGRNAVGPAQLAADIPKLVASETARLRTQLRCPSSNSPGSSANAPAARSRSQSTVRSAAARPRPTAAPLGPAAPGTR